MNGKTETQIPADTFEATIFAMLAHQHLIEYEHAFSDTDCPHAKECPVCIHLRKLETLLNTPAPDFTQADVDQMADIMLIEQEFAMEQARCYIDSATYPVTTAGEHGGEWNNTEVDSLRDRDNIAKAIKYLQHCKMLEVHPERPELVRIKEQA